MTEVAEATLESGVNPWQQVKLSDIQVEKTGFAPIPEGDYVFQVLPGAQYRTKQFGDGNTVTELNFRAAIVEGDNKGRQTFVTYPDPSSTNRDGKPKTWVRQAFKKLEVVLGVDAFADEDYTTYLNRVALQGARFGGKLEKNKKGYTKPGQTEPETELNLWSVRPAA